MSWVDISSKRYTRQLLWKRVWQVLKKQNIKLPYDLAITLLGMYPKELKSGTQTDISTQVSQ